MHPLSWLALAAILGAVVYSAWRRALLSLTLALAAMVVFLLEYVSGEVFQDLAWAYRPPVYVSPPWTIATTIFVHAGAFHLLFNVLGFLLITPVLEERIGSLRWGLVFFLGAMVGQVAFWLARLGHPFVLVGASGGLMAVLGAFARLYPRERISFFLLPLPGQPTVPVIWVAVGYLFVSFVLAAGSSGFIAHEAHIGGMAFGFAAAPAIMRVPARRAQRPLAALDFDALGPLAGTRELRQILEELKAADVPEVRAAWLEKFAANARCPRCGGPLRHRRRTLSSTCGWRLAL